MMGRGECQQAAAQSLDSDTSTTIPTMQTHMAMPDYQLMPSWLGWTRAQHTQHDTQQAGAAPLKTSCLPLPLCQITLTAAWSYMRTSAKRFQHSQNKRQNDFPVAPSRHLRGVSGSPRVTSPTSRPSPAALRTLP